MDSVNEQKVRIPGIEQSKTKQNNSPNPSVPHFSHSLNSLLSLLICISNREKRFLKVKIYTACEALAEL